MILIKTNSLQRQRGVVLAIGLIMLLLLTLIGITGSQVSGLEEKMAGNARDYNLAFQSAEATLREAENYIEGLTTAGDFDGTYVGLLSEADTADQATDYYTSLSTWADSSSIEAAGSFPQLPDTQQPRYIIKYLYLGATDANAKLNVTGYGENVAGGAQTIFKVTSRSVGGTGNSHVVLQTHYAKRF